MSIPESATQGLETVSHTAQVELGQLEHEEHVKREAEAGAETGENNPEENDVSSGETEVGIFTV